jgi:hypothetical protein
MNEMESEISFLEAAQGRLFGSVTPTLNVR